MFNEHKKFTDIFYKKNHRDFKHCDCYGLCYLFNKEVLKKEIPNYLDEQIETDKDINALYDRKKNEWIKVPKGKEAPGDVISINVKHLPVHVGVVVKKGVMLHILEDRHAQIESYNSIRWKNRINSFWRYESIK